MTQRVQLFLWAVAALLPLLALAALLWRRFYREDADNTARRVVKNSSLPIAANLLNRAIDFGFAAITLRALGPEGNGDYALATLVVALVFLTISNWGLNDLTVREVATDESRAARLFSITLLLRCGIALALVPLAAAIVYGYAVLGTPLSIGAIGALLLLTLHLFPAALAAACSASFQAFQRMEIPALVAVLTNIAKTIIGALVLFALADTNSRVIGLAAVALVATTFNAVVFFVLQQRLLFPARFEWDWPTGRQMLREAFPLLLNSLLIVVMFRFDVLILRGVADAATLGTYDAAYKWINMTTIVPAYFVAALFPVLARYAASDRAALDRAFRHALAALQVIAWPTAFAVTILADQLILAIGGTAYMPGAAWALAILIWFLPLSYINGVTQYVIIALRRQSAITVAFGIAATFNLVANLLLIPRYGIFAASALTVATEVVLLLPLLRVLRQEQALPHLLALVWRPALAALLMGGAMLAVSQIHWLLAVAVALPVYAAALWLLGAFGAEERALARRVLGR